MASFIFIKNSFLTTKECNSQINEMNCLASSEFSNNYPCENAIDRKSNTDWATKGEGSGAWIKLNFGGFYRVTSIRIKHRATGSRPSLELFKGISFEFSNGEKFEFTLNNIPYTSANGLVCNNIKFPNNPSSDYVKITATSVYGTINNGFSDIRVFGCRDGIKIYIERNLLIFLMIITFYCPPS